MHKKVQTKPMNNKSEMKTQEWELMGNGGTGKNGEK